MREIFNKINYFYIAIILFLIIVILHIDIITAPLGYYFSHFDLKDLSYYINIRQYAVDSIVSGIFPFWTTKLFSGIPFFANSETAIFYLPNVIFYFIPISKAFNMSFILHFFIFSFGVFLWINNKIKDKLVSLIVALVSIFFSNFYLHSCAAHLSNITTISWFPLLLYFYDKVYENKKFYFILPISFIISLQIFAGHFQYVYYSALFSLIYVLIFCRNKYTFVTIMFSYLISLLLTSIQFLPSLEFYFDGARRFGALEHFSFYSRIKYLITILFPITIHDIQVCFWEKSNYIGILNLLVIIVTLFYVRSKDIYKYFVFVLLIYLFSFEFFSNLANYCIPFFSAFRSPIKLNFFVGVFLLPILAYGIKRIFFGETKINKYFALVLVLLTLIMIVLKNNIINLLINILNKENGFSILCFDLSVMSLAVLILIFITLLLLKKYSLAKTIIVLLLIIEPVVVMRFYSRPFLFNKDYRCEYTSERDFNQSKRFFSNNFYNLSYNAENIAGSAPDILFNYFVFMKYLEKPFNVKNILGMLRCEYIVDDITAIINKTEVNTLNRLNVFYDYKVEKNKEKIYEILSRDDFDIFDTVILEKEPQYDIKDKGEYKIDITYFDENSIEFECETKFPAIILYTDNFSKDWTAYNIENPKEKYEILCADYIYKAISINEGYHKIRIEYKSKYFIIGVYVSIVSWILLIIFSVFLIYKNKKNSIMKTM